MSNNSYLFTGGEEWLEGVTRAVLGYAKDALIVNSTVDYDIQMGFPPDEVFDKEMPLDKVLIHFAIDDIANPIFGFGDNVIYVENQYDYPQPDQLVETEVQRHRINFDVGVWATERAGGDTARLRAYQRLTHAFGGKEAYDSCLELAGVQINNFLGGQFTEETINDIKVWRVMATILVIECFNRRYKTPVPYIQNVATDGVIHIEEEIIVESDS